MDKVDYPVKAVFIPGQRGTEVLLDPLNNKMTKKSNEANGKAIYECSKKRSLNCPVKVTLDIEAKMIVSARGEHSHDSDLMKAWVKKEQDKVVMGVYKNPSVPPRAIFQEIQNRVMSSPATSSGMALLPKASSLARQVQRKRKAERGPEGNLPTSWQDMIIPLQYHHTTGGENFIISEESQALPKLGKIWIFASPFSLSILRSSEEWFLDGTFDVVKFTLFSQVSIFEPNSSSLLIMLFQLYVVVAKAPRSTLCIPCVYALLPDKSKATYLILFNKLKELNMSGPRVAHMDYEIAVFSSMKKTFPQTRLVGCDTHWKRNLRKNQSEVGLLKFINTELAIQTWTRMLWALSYVPPKDVVDVFKFIAKKMPVVNTDNLEDSDDEEEANNLTEALESHMEYFTTAYIGKVHPRTEIRASPKIPIELWSNYHAVLEGSNDLTNNTSENWNAVSKITLPMKPSIWSVLRSIQVEEQHSKARYHENLGARSEEEDSRKRTTDRLTKFKKLRAIVQSYGEIPIDDYITALISLFNEVGVE